VFGKSEKQDDLVKLICSDISVMSDLGDVRYYYGPESIIITFSCSESLESIDSFLKLLYQKMNIVYLLFPYDKDKMSLMMDSETSKHLFDIDSVDTTPEKMSRITKEVQKLFEETINSEILDSEISEEDVDIILSKQKVKEPTLDQILDKINENGISSLTEKELTLLNKYSK